jgi:hypothetical protein
VKWLAIVFAMLAIGVALVIGLRSRESRWIDVRATKIHVGPWVADIPEGWRDIHELRHPIAGGGVPIPGSRTLLRFEHDQLAGQIDVFELPRITGEEGCKTLADAIASQGSAQGLVVDKVEPATFAGDPGCIIDLQIGYARGMLLIRSHALRAVAVRCVGVEAGLNPGYGCERVIYGLKIGT